MSHIVTLSDVSEAFESGDLAAAKRQAKAYLNQTSGREREILAHCAEIVETHPRTARARLRNLWQRADNDAKAVILVFGKYHEATRQAPEPEGQRPPRWTKNNKYQAPSTVTRTVRPERATGPRRRADENPAEVIVYDETRAGIDDKPKRAERPDGYTIDYDRAAVPAQRGTECLHCWQERATADQQHPDNGLCGQCREDGRQGLTLPAEASRADVIRARCAFIVAHNPARTARGILCRDWEGSSQPDRAVMAAWSKANPLPEASATPKHAGPAPCGTCGQPRTPRDLRHQRTDDGQCVTCRADNPAPADATEPDPPATPEKLAACRTCTNPRTALDVRHQRTDDGRCAVCRAAAKDRKTGDHCAACGDPRVTAGARHCDPCSELRAEYGLTVPNDPRELLAAAAA